MDFSHTSIRFGRPILSYSKVQSVLTSLLRNNPLQRLNRSLQIAPYIDLGCGPNIHKMFVNADFNWLPGTDLCWDLTTRLPFSDKRFDGIFSEHFVEHLDLSDAEKVFHECRRIMKPGAIMRIVTPDAELYINTYIKRRAGGDSRFPYEGDANYGAMYSPILDVNRVFYQDRNSPYGHRFIYDFDFLRLMLERCGFSKICRRSFMQGSNGDLLIDTPHRALESLYLEATA